MLEAGQLIDQRYTVQRLLGSGAMASVYEVKHVTLHSRHAVKILNAELARSAGLRNRFLSEGRIQAQLRHPNIVAVTDIVTDPAPGLVMELIEGGTLEDQLRRVGPAATPEAALELFLPVLDAVGVAHEAGVVHRDLKPENILMATDRRGRPRPAVADFGIARVLEGASIEGNKRETEAGVRMGTVLYMSPEQVEGRAVDTRSDIFALGAILFELFTGQTAFDAPSQYATMKRIVEGDLPLRAVGDLHPGIAACIRTALAVDPDERFQSCEAFHDALGDALAGSGPLPARPSRSKAVTVIPHEPDPAAVPPPLPRDLGVTPPPIPASGRTFLPLITPAPPEPEPEPPPVPEVPQPPPLPQPPLLQRTRTTPLQDALDALEAEVPRASWEQALAEEPMQPPARVPTRVPPEPLAEPVSGGSSASAILGALLNLSMVLTGAGQLMNGQVGKGLLVLTVHWTLALVTCGSSMLVTAFLAALDSWLVGRKLQQGRAVSRWEWF